MRKFVDKFVAMDIQKAVELLERSAHVAVILPPNPDFDTLAAAETLLRVLLAQKKKIGLMTVQPRDQTIVSLPILKTLRENPLLPREFIVSLDTSRSPVAEMRYEKSERGIDVIFSPQSEELTKDAVSCKPGKMLCDAALVLGVQDIESLNGSLGVEPQFFSETPLINIDVSAANRKYAEVNLVEESYPAISQIVYHLASALVDGPLKEEEATLVLAGIFDKTEQFHSSNMQADTLLAASELVRLGARYNEATTLAMEKAPLELFQLCGRAAVRSKLDEEKGILWSFLTAEDFTKTGRGLRDASSVVRHLERNFPPRRLVALLSQDPEKKGVGVTLAGDAELLRSIQGTEAGEFQSPHLKLTVRFSSFREGEEFITSLLTRVL